MTKRTGTVQKQEELKDRLKNALEMKVPVGFKKSIAKKKDTAKILSGMGAFAPEAYWKVLTPDKEPAIE